MKFLRTTLSKKKEKSNLKSKGNNHCFSFFIFHFSFFAYFLIVVFQPATSFAQTASSSPYSRYGIGDLQFTGFAKNRGLSGLGYGITNPYTINFTNPASYSDISLTTFEVAGAASFYELKNSISSGNRSNLSFGYFAMAFPISTKKPGKSSGQAGLSFGLLPYSNVGYQIEDKLHNANGDEELHIYKGSGGLNQFYLGAGWSPLKNFSVGFNTSFLFGSLDQERRIEYSDASYYNTKIIESSIVNDFYYSFGIIKTFDSLRFAKSDSLVMLDKEHQAIDDSLTIMKKVLEAIKPAAEKDSAGMALQNQKMEEVTSTLQIQLQRIDSVRKNVKERKQKSDWSFNVGLTGSPSLRLKGKHTVFEGSYTGSTDNEINKDTILDTESKSGKLVLPLSMGLGFSFRQGSHLIFGSDFTVQNWKDYSLFGAKDSLQNSWRTSTGMQWVPNDRSNKSYFNIVQYRLGFHYEQTYLQLHDKQLNDYGLSIGFGFPVRRGATIFQVSMEAGRRGTLTSNLVEVNYLKCVLAFTLNDRWFVKPKFD